MLNLIEVKIIFGVFFTSIISGIIGMGGGVILMGIYSHLLPIKLAMVLHGVTQFASNSSRCFLHRRNIKSNIIFPYLIGVLFMFLALKSVDFVPNKAVVYLLLGLFPFLSLFPKLASFFNITRKYRPISSGLLVTAAQISSGASGGVLDIFYINSPLNRFQIIATKACTQSIGHLTKLIYYLSFFTITDFESHFRWWVYPAVAIVATLGSYIGKMILKNINEIKFRSMSKGIIYFISILLLYKAYFLIK